MPAYKTPMKTRSHALIVAAGRGTRAGGPLPKQWQDLAGRPVLEHTLAAFQRHPGIEAIWLVLHRDDFARAAHLSGVHLVEGGATRAESVRAGLEAMQKAAPDLVLIHDVARPLVSPAVIDAVLAALARSPGAAPALPVTDALWRGEGARVSGTVEREDLFRAQTPQGFRYPEILAAHRAHPGAAADDVEVARAAGLEVAITPGEEANLKITLPGDFARAERLMEAPMRIEVRTGLGYDVHAFAPGTHVTLCGIEIEHMAALLGHSDADVGMHALTDALYGALAEGDIGRHFPPSDPKWRGAASEIFLRHAAGLVRERGWEIANCDVTLICEAPKIGPHAEAMQARLAEIMGVEAGRVSVKATTSERLGFTGRGEGIAAQAIATLTRTGEA